jgi:microsomal dipeptidase-like Zn-dependent dipeptidase
VIADMHCHYPMHLLVEDEGEKAHPATALNALVKKAYKRPSLWKKFLAAVLMLFARGINFRRFLGTWRVSLDGLKKADARLVFSVLYLPFAEFDNDEWPGGRPEDHYYSDLLGHLDQVETDLSKPNPDGTRHRVINEEKDLDAVLADKRLIGFAHCVEGGFHLGAAIDKIDERVKKLADRGVAYITLAHLFPRQVAANAPALPFLSDRLYNRIFPQAPGTGLTDIGQAAVKAMHKHGVLIDISHMREDAIEQTFDLLEALDEDAHTKPGDFPVIATHAGFRFSNDQSYMLSPHTIKLIAKRQGFIGLIMAQHQLNAGLDVKDAGKFEQTKKTICCHINEIDKHADAFELVGIGSDLDGFIKPTVGGIECARDLGKLHDALHEAYPGRADGILWQNAEHVLRKALVRRSSGSSSQRPKI